MRELIPFIFAGALAAGQDWIVMGAAASVNTTASGTVEFKYDLGKKQFAAAVLPAGDSFASMKSVRFRVRTDHDTTVGVLLTERKPGGGNYSAMFWSPAGVWQQIELTPQDFELSDGPTDPKDPDGKLDLDQVEGIGVVDLAILFENAADREKIVVTKATPGSHTILIENFEVRSTGPMAAQNIIDTFDRGFLQWMSPGGMALKFVPETGPLGEPSLKSTYEETSGPFAFMVRRVGGLDLAKAKHLTFDVASENEATIMVALETKQGGRYHQTIYPPAGRKVFHVDLNLGDFERETGPEKFDPSQWKTIGFTDISGVAGGGTSANTFWLGNLRTKVE